MLDWYINRYGCLMDMFSDLRWLLVLRENSDPAETLGIVKQRLDQTIKELANESQEEKETE